MQNENQLQKVSGKDKDQAERVKGAFLQVLGFGHYQTDLNNAIVWHYSLFDLNQLFLLANMSQSIQI
jgi:hypothetical protein